MKNGETVVLGFGKAKNLHVRQRRRTSRHDERSASEDGETFQRDAKTQESKKAVAGAF